MKSTFLNFLKFGFSHVFPQEPAEFSKGIPTAYSASPLSDVIVNSGFHVVWPHSKGDIDGLAVKPLHPNLPEACRDNKDLHEALALTDALRVGRAREKNIALEQLSQRLK